MTSHAEVPQVDAVPPPGNEDLLYSGPRARVLRHTDPGDGRTVVYKEPVGPGAGDHLRHERAILERLAHVDGVARLAPGRHPDGVIALEDTGGISLARALGAGGAPGAGQVPVATLLEDATHLARTLAEVHRAGVTHGAVTPGSVVVHAGRRPPLLVGFGGATTVAEHRPGFGHHAVIDSTLPYLAPERTGRTGRSVDQRADLYGLGATLYEAATGTPPFTQTDPLRLLHDVLTQPPTPPAERDPRVPQGLSDVIMRLLAKEPDQRYQSAEGLMHDLSRLRQQHAEGNTGTFPLGTHDFPLRLSAPSRLVGREGEIETLGRALAGVVDGPADGGRGVLVSGAPGVGKTVLVNELRAMVTARGGWFVSGKFDQYRQDHASDGGRQVLGALGRLLLTEPESDLREQRTRLLAALGYNAGLIAAAHPTMPLVLGVPPEEASGDSVQAERRLVGAYLEVLRTLASPDRPIVIVLDDLQWAGATPVALLDALLQSNELRGLLVVGAYREGEVDVTHPLSPMLARWERLTPPVHVLRPANLPDGDLGVMLAEMLRLAPGQAASLAEAVGSRSAGNPFDTVELVNALRRDGALVRDLDGWHWDAEQIRRHLGQGDVVDLLGDRLRGLPEPTAALLQRMACLGGELELGLLQLASGLPLDTLQERLLPAFEDGLLVTEHAACPDAGSVVRFFHDRVQQAAFGQARGPELDELRLELARRLASHPELASLAAEQYLPVVGALTDPAERRRVVDLFHAAARAGRLVNPTSTERLLRTALDLLGPEDDPLGNALRVRLETDHHAALFSLGRMQEVDRVYEALEEHSEDILDLAEAGYLQVSSLTLRNRATEAVELGLGLLRRLGVDVPEEQHVEREIARSLERFRNWVASEDLAEDLARPEAKDPTAMAVARIINRIIPPAFFTGMPVMPWLMFECQRLWVEHGPCAAMIGPMAHSGFVNIILGEDFRTGYEAVRHALAVSEERGYEPETSHARLMLSLSAGQWFEPLETAVDHARRALEGLLQGGDLQNAGFCSYVLVLTTLECTPSLEDWQRQMESCLAMATHTGNDQVSATLAGHRQLARALRGQTAELGSLSDASFDAVARLAELAGDPTAATYIHTAYALNAALFGDAAALDEHAAAAAALLPFCQSTLTSLVIHLLRALSLATSLRTGGSADREEHLAELDGHREWLARRAEDAPGNFAHLVRLVDAERAWALGDHDTAARTFDAALRGSPGVRRPWHAALMTEHAGLFHLDRGLDHVAHHLLVEARHLYDLWGASAKVRHLNETHGLLRASMPRECGRWHGERVTEPVAGESIDLMGVLRASQALSSETSLQGLKTRIGDVLRALTGATSVRVVLWRDDPAGWYLPGVQGPDGTPCSVQEAARDGLLPLSAFRYVERTREPLLVEDATLDDRFAGDPYVQQRERCSLLLMPVLGHGTPRAVLVLENGLSSGAFSSDRLDAVQLLGGQLTVSLENALVYEELEHRVRERTRELREMQGELVDTARRVGMAEIATNVLHNVGNVLNSVNASAGLVVKRMRQSKVDTLGRAVDLLTERESDLTEYLTRDPRGRELPRYLTMLAGAVSQEHAEMLEELGRLTGSVDHIKDIVATQQSYAGTTSLIEPVCVTALVEDALRMNAEALAECDITVVREFSAMPTTLLDKARIVLILVNLIRNARNSMVEGEKHPGVLTVRVTSAEDVLRVSVADTGRGIPAENLTRIFTHGFTTREGGHGFGLHSCALAAGEMRGRLSAHSDGPGLGAVFTLELPLEFESGRAPGAHPADAEETRP